MDCGGARLDDDALPAMAHEMVPFFFRQPNGCVLAVWSLSPKKSNPLVARPFERGSQSAVAPRSPRRGHDRRAAFVHPETALPSLHSAQLCAACSIAGPALTCVNARSILH
jgi:hypothetical protein